jgi:uncharacterized protein
MTKVIAIDIDEVLGTFADGFTEYHNEKYGTEVNVSDIEDYHGFNVNFGIEQKEIGKRVMDFWQETESKTIFPIEGAKEALKKLKEEGNILHVITARPETAKELTNKWLDEHFPDLFESITFTSHFSSDNPKTKGEVCVEIGAEILIEDCHSYALSAAERGIKVFLFDYPWNLKQEIPVGVTRVKNWDEVLEKI